MANQLSTKRQTDSDAAAMINPKDLTNEELEFIIRTGQLPPRFQYTPGITSSSDLP